MTVGLSERCSMVDVTSGCASERAACFSKAQTGVVKAQHIEDSLVAQHIVDKVPSGFG
jgi:hypothetical protein